MKMGDKVAEREMKEKWRKRRGRGGNERLIWRQSKKGKKNMLAQTDMHSQYTLHTDAFL